MEENYEGAVLRERTLKNAASRRKNWIKRKWQTSFKGNPFIRTDGFIITAYKKENYWSFSINKKAEDKVYFAKKQYISENAAKLAAFDAMVFLKNKNS